MTTLQTVNASASPEVQMNENFAALSAAAIFSYNAAASSALTWGYYGGLYGGNTIANGTVALTNTADNYVVVLRSTGVVSVSTSSTNSLNPLYAKLYKVTCAGGVVTAVVDQRMDTNGLLYLVSGVSGRERLVANRTYYVRTDGNDANDGLANTSGGAFLTVQAAVNVVQNNLSLNGYAVTIQIADGTYTGAIALGVLADAGSVTIQGNSGTPSNVVISTTSADAITAYGSGAKWLVKDLKIQTTTSGHCILAQSYAEVHYSNIVFGAAVGRHLYASVFAVIWCDGNYSITGGASVHFGTDGFGHILCYSKTITITGTPAFGSAFALAAASQMYLVGNTYSGSATGKRYDASVNGVIQSGTTLPGNVAGTTATGGQYT